MIVLFLHGRTHVPLYATPGCGQTTSVGGPSIHHESYPQVLVRLFPKDPPSPFLPLNYLRLWPQHLIQRPFLRL